MSRIVENPQLKRLMLLFAVSGLLATTANYACLPDVCADLKTAELRTTEELDEHRIETLRQALGRHGMALSGAQQALLAGDGKLLGLVTLDRPVKHPDGTVEMPEGWLPEVAEGHPWASPLTPSDDAFYSFFEERILKARLYDPENPEHAAWAKAYLAKSRSNDPEFIGWTYANRTECAKMKFDAKGTMQRPDASRL
jgi:hypothetical protein